MRFLHAGHAHHRACAPQRGAGGRPRAHPRGSLGEHLPLHRLRRDHRSRLRGPLGLPQMNFIGKPVERIEDLRLLRGRGEFVDDLHRDGMLHAAILRSAVPHGILKKIDLKKATEMPGVHAVFTAADVGPVVPTIPLRLAPLPELVPYEQPVIAHDKVRYVGEPVALVVAESLAQAEDALEAIELDIEPLPAAADRHAGELAIVYTATKGDALSIKAPYVRKERFAVQRHTAVCLEPRGLLADWDGAKTKMTV